MKLFSTLLCAALATLAGAQNLNNVTYAPNPVHECENVVFTLHGNYPSNNYTPVNMIFTPGDNTMYFAASGTGTSPQTNFNEAANPVGPFSAGPQSLTFYLMLNSVVVDSFILNINVIGAAPFDPGISTYNDSVCPGGPAIPLISFLDGTPSSGGEWLAPGGIPHGPNLLPGIDPPGFYTYQYVPMPPCTAVGSEVQIIYRPGNNPGYGIAFGICINAAPVDLQDSLGGTPYTPGIWTAPGGGTFSGIYDPSVNNPGFYTYTVPPIAPCTIGSSSTMSVTEAPLPDAGINSSVTICATDTAFQLNTALGGSPDTTGIWQDPSHVMFGTWGALYNAPVCYTGTYTYIVTAANCTPDSAFVLVTEDAAPCGIGISEVAAGIGTFEVRPNPSEGYISVNIVTTIALDNALLEVLDIIGSVVHKDRLTTGAGMNITRTIDLHGLPGGAYFIRLTSEQSIVARRFMLR